MVYLLLGAALSPQEQAEEWMLAASPFTVTGDSDTLGMSPLGTALPKLLLEQFVNLGNRTLLQGELESREDYELRQKRLALITEYAAEIKKRDGIILESITEREQAKKISAAETRIDDVKKRLEENLAAAADVFNRGKSSPEDIPAENRLLPLKLWKEDELELFTPAADITLQTQMIQERISALLTGTISMRGDYFLVSVRLTLFPGEIAAGAAADSGAVDELEMVARRLAAALVPILLNESPSELHFTISPSDSIVYIDERTISLSSGPVRIDPGIHTVSVEKNGYESISFTYSFDGGGRFLVQADLSELYEIPLTIVSGGSPGNIYLNATPRGSAPARVTVNNRPVLGEYLSPEGINTYFILYPRESGTVSIRPETIDLAEKIEKNRRKMYNSLGALFISLPLLFLSQGLYESTANSYILGRTSDLQSVYTWNTIRYISIGISSVLGANFIFHLGKYIYTANKIIPQTGKIE
jgi:hypothetical protein